jgi:hypothetical protein
MTHVGLGDPGRCDPGRCDPVPGDPAGATRCLALTGLAR